MVHENTRYINIPHLKNEDDLKSDFEQAMKRHGVKPSPIVANLSPDIQHLLNQNYLEKNQILIRIQKSDDENPHVQTLKENNRQLANLWDRIYKEYNLNPHDHYHYDPHHGVIRKGKLDVT